MGDVVGGRLEFDTRPVELAGAVEPPTTEASRAGSRPQYRPKTSRLHFWRSPDDQPRWARPALMAVAALAAFAYAWGMNGDMLETFYGGAVRSMSQNWHNFFFGAFDPWGTVSIDKLPGAFWVQALSVRVFGFHVWAFVLPQVVEGTLTVLVLYRAVRRVAGAGAGLLAAGALVVTPVTILLNRGNISDSLLILLLVLAADAATNAFMSGRLRRLVAACSGRAGVPGEDAPGLARAARDRVGLADGCAGPQPVLPFLADGGLRGGGTRRLAELDVRRRPGAGPGPAVCRRQCNDSEFSQVFLYNGADRLNGKVLEQPGCSPPAATTTASAVGGAPNHHAGTRGRLDTSPGRSAATPPGSSFRPWSGWSAS